MDPISSARNIVEIKWDTPYRILGSLAGILLIFSYWTKRAPHENLVFVFERLGLPTFADWSRSFASWMNQNADWVAVLATFVAMGAIISAVAKMEFGNISINKRRAPATSLIVMFFLLESGFSGGWVILALTVAGRAVYQHYNQNGMPAYLWVFTLPFELFAAAFYVVFMALFWMYSSDEELKGKDVAKKP